MQISITMFSGVSSARSIPAVIGMWAMCCLFGSCTQPETPKAEPTESVAAADTSLFDPVLAEALEADPYGMCSYVMAFLKAGPNRSQDSLEAARLQQAHLDNIKRMAEEGSLLLAGPFLDNGEVRGIYIFDVRTIAEAEALTNTDPAIQAGSLVMELHPWYGSAALKQLNDLHVRVQATSF